MAAARRRRSQAASAASRTPGPSPRRPANIAAAIASRCVSRAIAASSGSRRRAASAAVPARRCRACGRTRSPRASAPAARAEARRAERARRSPAARARRPPPQHRTSPARQPGRACPLRRIGGQLRRARQERRSGRRAPTPAPDRPTAPTRRPPPRRHPPPREHDATPVDRDRYPDRSLPPTPDAQLAAVKGPPPGTPRIAPVDAGTGHALPPRPAARLPPGRASSFFDAEPVSRAQTSVAVADRLGRAGSSSRWGSGQHTGALEIVIPRCAGGLSQREARSRPPASAACAMLRGIEQRERLPRVSATMRSRTRSSSRPGRLR